MDTPPRTDTAGCVTPVTPHTSGRPGTFSWAVQNPQTTAPLHPPAQLIVVQGKPLLEYLLFLQASRCDQDHQQLLNTCSTINAGWYNLSCSLTVEASEGEGHVLSMSWEYMPGMLMHVGGAAGVAREKSQLELR